MEEYDSEAIQAQAPILKCVAGIAHNMALKCAIDLCLADILHSHENPITLSELASSINSSTPPNVSSLKRVMRLLVRDKIFSAHEPSDGGETLYGATKTSSWLLDSETSLSIIISLSSEPTLLNPWCNMSRCVKEGGTGFEKFHGCQVYEFASQNPEFNKRFNQAMAAESKYLVLSILNKMDDALKNVTSLVDVGGNTGDVITSIVKKHPQITGINFDLPHVLSTAPEIHGVTHVGGNMFEAIPEADAIFMKYILHNWNDEACSKILKNCKKAIPKEGGKIIIVDIVLNPEGSSEFDEAGIFFDLNMLVTIDGVERTEPEWKRLLEDGGFPRYRIINVNPKVSLIEAYPE
ncbi:hypothetical protein ACFE04_031329 [Oxalis oulophora]